MVETIRLMRKLNGMKTTTATQRMLRQRQATLEMV